MKEYIERADVHELVKGLPKYQMFNYDRTKSLFGINPDDVDFGVDKMPAADVAPVRHGRWIEKTIRLEDGYIGEVFEETCYCCSNCNHETWDKTPYCPNCGALMREIENGEK